MIFFAYCFYFQIDWGIEDDGGIDYGDDAGIDFGDDANIDWGDGAEEVVITVEEDGQGIFPMCNYGNIICLRSMAFSKMASMEIQTAFLFLLFSFVENPDGGVATGQEALSVMENTATRNTFIDELMEVMICY